ncbi:hypothetical protein C7M84_018681 [Penaeus vannamei]|uniref:Uncharacterized protein n=1 Tax=Penaeus vannamei TaxID=6689 RepID=A0A3R7LZU5_PENVA|nr:hypothetical protein C7M84_018681 [Penaeus vannamei]
MKNRTRRTRPPPSRDPHLRWASGPGAVSIFMTFSLQRDQRAAGNLDKHVMVSYWQGPSSQPELPQETSPERKSKGKRGREFSMQLRAPGCQEVSLQQKSITWCPRSGSGAAREARAVPLGHKTATETRHKDFSESGGGRTQPSDELRGRFRVRMPLKETKRREMPYLSPGERMYGWAGHARSTSTTVSFTAEELRAFKARRAHAHTQEASAHSSDNKENAPRPLHPSQSSPSLSSSTALRSLASEGSTTSLASGGAGSSFTSGRSGSPASPAKLSPAHSWRTSLDSLHRPPLSSPSPPATATASSDAPSSSPRPITRATSLADPLNKEEAAAAAMSGSVSQEALHLPSTSSVSESLNRIAAISDSLSRSTSVTESLCRSTSLTETPTSTHSRASSVSEVPTYLSSPPAAPASSTPAAPSSPTSPVPHDGPVTAHPATVTEEPSPRPLLSTPKAPSSPKSPLSTKSLSSKSSLSPTPLSPTSPLSPTTSKAPTFPSSSASTTATPSFPVTSPSMSPTSSSADKSNIVVLGYGRTRYQEEIDCDQLSKDYAPHLLLDTKLRALLGEYLGNTWPCLV